MVSQLGAKLQARIQTAAQAGGDVTALNTALSDIQAKLADAQTQAQNSVNTVGPLQPDQGDKTKMDQNNTAIASGRADIKTATTDLSAARKDVNTILAGLKKIKTNVNASSTTQTSTGAATH
jgi:predicted  nucleic acid-binding Zn-ribbon protein